MDRSDIIKDRINSAIEQAQTPYFPNSISPTVVLHDCKRHVLLTHIWAAPYKFHYNAKQLRVFALGSILENYITDSIKLAAFKLDTIENEQQISYYRYNKHVHGKIDGIITIANEKHIVEVKTLKDNIFQLLKKKKLKLAINRYYLQIQLYLHYFKMNSAYLIAYNKNDSEIYIENIIYDKTSITKLINNTYALRNKITNATVKKFKKVNPKEPKEPCKRFGGCPFKDICFSIEHVYKSCRSCIHATKSKDKKHPGEWFCESKNIFLNLEDQKTKANKCLSYKPLEL